jgi:hypothetical protein
MSGKCGDSQHITVLTVYVYAYVSRQIGPHVSCFLIVLNIGLFEDAATTRRRIGSILVAGGGVLPRFDSIWILSLNNRRIKCLQRIHTSVVLVGIDGTYMCTRMPRAFALSIMRRRRASFVVVEKTNYKGRHM